MLRQIKRDNTPTVLYNPLTEDFTVQMADEENNPHQYTIHAGEVETFPAYIANHIRKHLASKIYLDRYGARVTQDFVMPDILKELDGELEE